MARSPEQAPAPRAAAAVPPLLTGTFVRLCVVGFLGYTHMSLLTPVLPLYVQEQGGSATFIGLVVAAFSIPSFLLRPFIGRLVDTWSTRGILGLGTAALAVSSFLYPIVQLGGILFVRPLHGLGWAGLNTGANTLLSRVAPVPRRGMAIGLFISAQGVSQAV